MSPRVRRVVQILVILAIVGVIAIGGAGLTIRVQLQKSRPTLDGGQSGGVDSTVDDVDLPGDVERTGVLDEFLVGQIAVFADPVARHKVLDIGNVTQRLEARAPGERTIRLRPADDFDHVTALAGDGGADGGLTAGKGVV